MPVLHGDMPEVTQRLHRHRGVLCWKLKKSWSKGTRIQLASNILGTVFSWPDPSPTQLHRWRHVQRGPSQTAASLDGKCEWPWWIDRGGCQITLQLMTVTPEEPVSSALGSYCTVHTYDGVCCSLPCICSRCVSTVLSISCRMSPWGYRLYLIEAYWPTQPSTGSAGSTCYFLCVFLPSLQFLIAMTKHVSKSNTKKDLF